jgi:hypothetical protein
MWRVCVFTDEADFDSIDQIMNSIQDTLVSNLCYLTTVQYASFECLHLTLDIYSEYGWYLLHRYVGSRQIEEQVPSWHANFSGVLLSAILNDNEREYA